MPVPPDRTARRLAGPPDPLVRCPNVLASVPACRMVWDSRSGETRRSRSWSESQSASWPRRRLGIAKHGNGRSCSGSASISGSGGRVCSGYPVLRTRCQSWIDQRGDHYELRRRGDAHIRHRARQCRRVLILDGYDLGKACARGAGLQGAVSWAAQTRSATSRADRG